MGAGRKTKTYKLTEKSQPASSVNCSTSARNLKKSELGGVIFGCKYSTIKECFQKQLFGLPEGHISYVKNICPGLPLFLFNYSDRKLHGIFEAASIGKLNINPHGWTEGGSDCTPFAAQVKFKTWMQCQPLLEDQFGPVIADNYYEPRLFWFELDHGQTNKLISLFSSSPVTASSSLPKSTAKQSTLLSNLRQQNGGPKRPALDLNVANQKQANIYGGSSGDGIRLSEQSKCLEYDGRSYSSVLKNSGHSIGHLKHAHTGQSSLDTHGLCKENGSLDAKDNEEVLERTKEISSLPSVDQFNTKWESPCIGLNGQINSSKDFVDESRQFDEEFECLKQQMEDLCSSVATEDNSCLPQSVPCESLSTANAVWEGRYLEARASEGNTYQPDKSEIKNSCLSEGDLLSNVNLPDVHFIVDKVQQEVNKLKLKQFKQEQKISSLEKQLVDSRREIKNLKQQLKTSGCISFQETNLVTESESSVDESVLIIGGYNGLSYVSALECYSPSHDLLESLCPMSSTRSCTSTVKLNSEVYVIGGLHDNLWYDTVESYNLVENQWVTRPSLNRKKGSLAGISLNEKIFAIGGGNGVQCFSEVELFDLHVGRWIPTRSMLNKRFTPAAAEINGMIYVVGGYDGDDYLKSVEGFDPRENSWSRLEFESMSTKRGCHSLAVLNEKFTMQHIQRRKRRKEGRKGICEGCQEDNEDLIYAIGGYNGTRMISTVEVFDPRIGSWIMGESMNTSRGYFAAVVIGNSIFAIGGLNEKEEVLDTVECYKEAHGWQSTNLKAIGKRCYLTAVPLSG